jgi:hypothetical protein
VFIQGIRAEVAAEVEKEAHKRIEEAKAEVLRASEAAAKERAAAEEAAKRAEEAIKHWEAWAKQNEGAIKALERDIRTVVEVLTALQLPEPVIKCHFLVGSLGRHPSSMSSALRVPVLYDKPMCRPCAQQDENGLGCVFWTFQSVMLRLRDNRKMGAGDASKCRQNQALLRDCCSAAGAKGYCWRGDASESATSRPQTRGHGSKGRSRARQLGRSVTENLTAVELQRVKCFA